MSILEGELAETIGDALIDADIPHDVTVIREEEDPESPDFDPEFIDVEYPCQGFVDTYALEERDGTLIQTGDVKVVVVAKTLEIDPTTAEKVKVRGTVYSIASVRSDPALALWELQGRA